MKVYVLCCNDKLEEAYFDKWKADAKCKEKRSEVKQKVKVQLYQYWHVEELEIKDAASLP